MDMVIEEDNSPLRVGDKVSCECPGKHTGTIEGITKDGRIDYALVNWDHSDATIYRLDNLHRISK